MNLRCFFPVPVLVVNPRAVQQRGQEVLSRTHTLQHQADPIHRCQEEGDECEKEAAMVGLPYAAVDPKPGEFTKTQTLQTWTQ